MTDVALIPDEIGEDLENKNNVRCQFCNSLILSKKAAKYVLKEVCRLNNGSKILIIIRLF